MESGAHYSDILALGKRIVIELGLPETSDTLGRWMAHHVADMMEDAQRSSGAERVSKEAACADVILKLWAHRRTWSNGPRPLEDFEPVFRALESLDPNPATPRYFARVRLAMGKEPDIAAAGEETPKATNWLEVASRLDYTARALIRYCLARAIEHTAGRSEEWLNLARAAMSEDNSDLQATELVIRIAGLLDADSEHDDERRDLQELSERLNAFADVASELSAHLRVKLNEHRTSR
jgi:hypothetical protein